MSDRSLAELRSWLPPDRREGGSGGWGGGTRVVATRKRKTGHDRYSTRPAAIAVRLGSAPRTASGARVP